MAKEKWTIYKRLWIFFAALFGIVMICFAIFSALQLFKMQDQREGLPQINLASTAYSVRAGEEGNIQAVLSYENGDDENGEFSYKITEGNEANVLCFVNADENGESADGLFRAMEPAAWEKDSYSVTISVECTNVAGVNAAEITIDVIPADTTNITFRYSIYNQQSSVVEARAETLSISNGQALGEIVRFDPDQMYPYRFDGWYVVKDGDVTALQFGEEQIFYSDNWAGEIILQAKYTAEVTVDFDTDAVADSVAEVVYGQVTEDISCFDTKLSELVSEGGARADWQFDGWATESGGEARQITDLNLCRFFSDGDGITLFPRWSTTITVDTVFEGEESNIEVVYNAPIDYGHTYSDGGLLEGIYYTDEAENKALLAAEEDESGNKVVTAKYLYAANMRFTAEVSFAIRFEDMGDQVLTDEGLRIVYGGSYTGELPGLEDTEDGWKFENWTVSGELFDGQYVHQQEGALTLVSRRTTTVTFYHELDEAGNADADLVQTISVVYGSELSVPQDLEDITVPADDASGYTGGVWEFCGWRTQRGGKGDEMADVPNYTGAGNAEFYAAWQTDITFDYALPVAGESEETLSVYYNGEVEYPEPEYTSGGQFIGWYYVEGGLQYAVDNQTLYTLKAGQLLVAEVQFTLVLYDWNGRDEAGETQIYYRKSVNTSGFELGSLSDEDGWSFIGWYTLSSENDIDPFDSDTVFSDTYVNMAEDGAVALYSGRATTVSLYRELDEEGKADQSAVPIEQGVIYGGKLELPEVQADSWSFGGWFTQPGGAGEEMIGTQSYTGSGSVVLYAKWNGTATIRLTFKDFTIGVSDGQEIAVTYKGPVEGLPDIRYTNGGVFAGWYTEQFGNGIQLVNGETVYNVSSLEIYDATRFSLIFEYTDGSYGDCPDQMSVIYGQTIGDDSVGRALPAPQMDGWNFVGWFTADGSQLKDEDVYSAAGNLFVSTRWSKTVVYKDDTGSITGDQTEQTIYFGDEDMPLRDPGSFGDWTFGGWYTEQFGMGDKLENTSEIAEADIVLYAYWYIDGLTLYYKNADNDSEVIGKLIYGKTVYGSTGRELPDLESEVGSPPFGYVKATGWFNNRAFQQQITDDTVYYPADMDGLYLQWSPGMYHITFTDEDGSYLGECNIYYDSTVLEGDAYVSVPKKEGYIFTGYYYNDQRYFSYGDGERAACEKPWNLGNATLVAHWQIETYRFHFEPNGGSATEDIDVEYGGTITLPQPTRTGYRFLGWYLSDENGNGTGTRILNGSVAGDFGDYGGAYEEGISEIVIPLYAAWEAIKIESVTADPATISGLGGEVTITVTVKSTEPSYTGNYTYEASKNGSGVDVNGGGTSNQFTVQKTGNSQSGKIVITVTDNNNGETGEVSIDYTTSNGCFAKGSLITLADGTAKKVEELSVGDAIMVFNHFTGELDSAPISYIFYDGYKEYEVLNLYFSDGTVVNVLFGHGFFDKESNEYVVITPENVKDYVGHSFCNISAGRGGASEVKWVRLTAYTVTREYTECYSIFSAVHVNHIVNGMLAVTDEIEGLYNIFEYGPGLKYDEAEMQADIEKYGLFSYEEWADYVTYEQFIAFNGPYIKISIGKGLTSYEAILSLIKHYLS